MPSRAAPRTNIPPPAGTFDSFDTMQVWECGNNSYVMPFRDRLIRNVNRRQVDDRVSNRVTVIGHRRRRDEMKVSCDKCPL